MFMLRFAAAAAVFVMPCAVHATSTAAYDSDCWSSDEIASAHIHHLQIKLMVDSLKCQDTIPATLQSYNDFMNTRRNALVAHKRRVEAHFVRRDGGQDGIVASDDYNTRVGNQVSSPVIDVVQCERAGTIARLATAASEADLLVLADTIVPDRIIRDCPDAIPVSDRPRAMVVPVWTRKTEPALFDTTTAPAPVVAALMLPPALSPAARSPAALSLPTLSLPAMSSQVASPAVPPPPVDPAPRPAVVLASAESTPTATQSAQVTTASILQTSPALAHAEPSTDPVTALKAAIAALAQAAAALPWNPAGTPNQ